MVANVKNLAQEVEFAKPNEEETVIALPTSAFQEKRECSSLMEKISNINWRLVFAFIQWYGLNLAYNICNKIFLNKVSLPWTASAYQLLVAWFFMLIYWGCNLRPAPYFETKRKFITTFLPLGFLNLFVHLGAVLAMGIGEVSFTHVIKSGEPVFTALISVIFLREYLNIYAYLALIPVVVGVALTSMHEVNFDIRAFIFAMVSNVSGAARSVFSKVTMKNKNEIGENLSTSNIFIILTLVSSIMALPCVLIIEAASWAREWRNGTVNMDMGEKAYIVINLIASGFFYFLSTDAAFYCLSQINQVSYSVANTAKRVVIIAGSILVFRNKVEPLGYVGMNMAVLGTLLYSLVK